MIGKGTYFESGRTSRVDESAAMVDARVDTVLSECSGGGVRVMVTMPHLVCDIDITTLLRCLVAFKSSMGLLVDAHDQVDCLPMVEWSAALSCPHILLSF